MLWRCEAKRSSAREIGASSGVEWNAARQAGFTPAVATISMRKYSKVLNALSEKTDRRQVFPDVLLCW